MGPPFPLEFSEDCPFGLQNIPFGIFSTSHGIGHRTPPRAGTAIGNFVLDLDLLVKHGLFDGAALSKPLNDVFLASDLNAFAAFPAADRSLVRAVIIENLASESSDLFEDVPLNSEAFIPLHQVQMHVPLTVTDYTDFFSSLVHAQNVLAPLGIPIPRAFHEYPMAYNGRISSIAASGTEVVRPKGFFTDEGDLHPTYQPTRELDFEVELGVFMSSPIEAGKTVSAESAADHVFGFVLLNDWSARDIQKYEMAPFGPFHSKSFLTSISPWVVTLDALKGSQSGPPASNSTPISPTLVCDRSNHGLYDISLSAKVSRKNAEYLEIVRSNLADAYWSPFQMIAYQSSSGCGMHTGDLLGSGTLSSPGPKDSNRAKTPTFATYGCLAEIIACDHTLPDVGGRPMLWLEDWDQLTIEGWFRTTDGGRAGFGGVTGLVVPARYE